MIQAIVFDFDGVIIRRSEFFKREAWNELFPPGSRENVAYKKADEQCGQGRGGDRFDIIRHVYSDVAELRGEALERRIADVARCFDTLVQKKILEAGIDADDRRALVELGRKYSLYINSATPIDALTHTLHNLGLEEIFTGVLGRPYSKIENFKRVAHKEHCTPQGVLFVGDGKTDVIAAKEFGCSFVGLGNEWNKWQKDKKFCVVQKLSEIQDIVLAKS